MAMIERDIAMIDELRSAKAETAWLDFKVDNYSPETIGKYCSALSNGACIEQRDRGYLVWGIDDSTHDVVGTNFSPETCRVGDQPLELWLANALSPSIAFSFQTIEHPDGRLVVLHIPAARQTPVAFQSIAYLRIGPTTPKLADYPERHQRLIEALRPYGWEQGVARAFTTPDDVLRLLDYAQYFKLSGHPLPDNRVGIFDKLAADRLIAPDVGGHWNITNLGAILFANQLADFDPALARKGVRFVAYGGRNKAAVVTHRIDEKRGYAVAFESLVGVINGLLPKNEHIGEALREAHPLFPEIAIRELVANALIHQDMTITGAGPQIELFADRIEISNPGQSLIEQKRMVDHPPRSRNAELASLMRRMNICEEQGSGLDKVLEAVEFYQLPAPLFRSEQQAMQVVLFGPRRFAEMSPEERIWACYWHAVLKFLSGDKMKNASLCQRLGIESRNAAQASTVINRTLNEGLIRFADPEHPRAGYLPWWA